MDQLSPSTLLLALILLFILSACFSAAETAMMSINPYKLLHLARKKLPAAMRTQTLLKRPDRLLAVILLGNTFANILASSLCTLLAFHYYGEMGIVGATLALTFLILIFAETAPKTLAALHPEKVAFPLSFLLTTLLKLCSPLITCMNWLSNGFLRCFGIKTPTREIEQLSTEELRGLLINPAQKGQKKHSMMAGILDLELATVNDIMVPKQGIFAIDIDQPWNAVLQALKKSPHGHVLFYREQIDAMIGVVALQKILHLMLENRWDQAALKQHAKPVAYVPEGTPLMKQLHQFQSNSQRLALVIDEYNQIQGLITLADILEEIVGAYSEESLLSLTAIAQAEDGSVTVPGHIQLRDLNRQMNWSFPTDGPNTLSGLIIETLEHVPKNPLGCYIDSYAVDILKIKNNQITLVKIHPTHESA